MSPSHILGPLERDILHGLACLACFTGNGPGRTEPKIQKAIADRVKIMCGAGPGLELQRAGLGRVNQIRAVQVSKPDAINMLQSNHHRIR